MRRRLLSHLSYANAMATVAVFLALTSGAYAAFTLPANAVGARQLKSHAVTPAKVARATIALFKGQAGAKGLPGAPGPQGAQGAPGPAGPQGPGATSLATTLPQGSSGVLLTTMPDGVRVSGDCTSAPLVRVHLDTVPSSDVLELSGTTNAGGGVFPVWDDSPNGYSISDANNVAFDVIVRDATTNGKFDRVDVFGRAGSPCTYWVMTTPSG